MTIQIVIISYMSGLIMGLLVGVGVGVLWARILQKRRIERTWKMIADLEAQEPEIGKIIDDSIAEVDRERKARIIGGGEGNE